MERLSNWFDEGVGAEAPDCPHCQQPLRSTSAKRDAIFRGVANLPWNSGWDGACEQCGTMFEVRHGTMGTYQVSEDGYASTSIGEPVPPSDGLLGRADSRPAAERFMKGRPFREVRVRPGIAPVRTFIDEGVVFAGLEVTVASADFGAEASEQRITLTVDELRSIVEALNGPLAPLAEQWGWSVDDT